MKSILTKVQTYYSMDYSYFIRGGFWLSMMQLSVLILGLISTLVLANMLSSNDFGIYKYVLTLAGIIGAISLTGLNDSILQITAKKQHSFYAETLKLNLLSSLPASLLAAGVAAYYFYAGSDVLAICAICIAAAQPFINTLSNQAAFLQGKKQFQQSTLVIFVQTAISTSTVLITVIVTGDVLLTFLAFLAGQLFAKYLTHWYVLSKNNTIGATDVDLKKTYLNFAKNTSIRNAISLISGKLDAILLFTYLGANNLAVYSIAILLPEHLKGFVRNILTLIIPKYTERDNLTQTIKSIPKRCTQLFIPLSIVAGIYIATVPFILPVLFPKYEEAIFYTQLLALSLPTAILFVPYNFIKSQVSEKILYQITILATILQLSLVLILTVLYGTIGAIIAITVYRYLFMFLVFFFYKKTAADYLYNFSLSSKDITPT